MTANNIVIIGASGAIGSALTTLFAADAATQVFAFSRSEKAFAQPNIHSGFIDLEDETSIADAATTVSASAAPAVVVICAGILHNDDLQPEKAVSQLSPQQMSKVFAANSIGPALVMKHFLPIMPRKNPYVLAALSARVGSISDNRLGGWYSYRASKAALNMLIKTASIEARRKNKQSMVVGLHPGTVDSALSRPFQKNVAADKLFTPEYCAQRLTAVIDGLTAIDSGCCLAWDGAIIDS